MTVPIVVNLTSRLIEAEGLSTWLTIGATLALLLLLARAGVRLRGTTLAAPCRWAMISALSVGLVVWRANSHGAIPSSGVAAIRFFAAATTFCPLMAVLGAKRPQDRGWQWVVATLWLILVWPAGQAVLSRTDLDFFIAWRLFLVGLIALGLLNYFPTRFWLASVFVALGQMALFSEFLWTAPLHVLPWMQTLGVGCFLAAGVAILLRCRRTSSSTEAGQSELNRFDAMWRQFRDSYGALWGLRIVARVNETAELRNWPMRLTWGGFAPEGAPELAQPTPDQLEELRQTMSALLRRFL